MKQITIPVQVYVLEDSDLEGYTEGARVRAELNKVQDRISDELPDGFHAVVGEYHAGRKGNVTFVRVAGPSGRNAQLVVGEGVVVDDVIPQVMIPAHVVEASKPKAPAKAVAKKAA